MNNISKTATNTARAKEEIKAKPLVLLPSGSLELSIDSNTRSIFSSLRTAFGEFDLLKSNPRTYDKSIFGSYGELVVSIKGIYKSITKSKFVLIFYSSESYFIKDLFIPIVLSKIFGKKVILNILEQNPQFMNLRYQRLINNLLKQSDTLVVTTKMMEAHFERLSIPTQKIAYSVSFPKDATALKEITPKILVSYVNENETGLNSLLKTFKYIKQKYPRAELTISTKTSMMVALQLHMMKQNIKGISFDLSDKYDYQKNIYEDYEIFINLSKIGFFPTQAIEAMGNGLVVISSTSNLAAEIIEDNSNGIILDKLDYKNLSDSVHQLIDNHKRAIAISEKALEIRNQFPEEESKKSWDKIFQI